MPINSETQDNVSVILDKEIHEKIKSIAKENHRSVSAQIAFIIEQWLKSIEKGA